MTRTGNNRRSRRRLWAAAWVLMASDAMLAFASPDATAGTLRDSSTPQTVMVGDAAEAWYAASPIDTCSTPLGGCVPGAPAPTSPYPADTLHIGEAARQETARTYLLPDLSQLPFGSTAVSATMTVPVDTGNTDGTASPAAATIKACLATQAFPDNVQGSTAAPPAVDCATTTPVHYDADKSLFSLDITPFVTKWAQGGPAYGLALIPDTASAQPTDAWHITINDRKRAGPHITSSLTVQVPADSAAPPPPLVGAPLAPAPTSQPLPAPASIPPDTGTAPQIAPATTTAPAPAAATQPIAYITGFQYPAVFLLPLGLIGLAAGLARIFTRDLTPVRR